VLSAPAHRISNALVWILPVLGSALVALPIDEYFLFNFAFFVIPQICILGVLMYFDLRQPELAVTAAALAALPFIWTVVATHKSGQSWFGELVSLPGFGAGAFLTLVVSRRIAVSMKSLLVAACAPYAGAASGILLLTLLQN
jgi:hypothetical protein